MTLTCPAHRAVVETVVAPPDEPLNLEALSRDQRQELESLIRDVLDNPPT